MAAGGSQGFRIWGHKADNQAVSHVHGSILSRCPKKIRHRQLTELLLPVQFYMQLSGERFIAYFKSLRNSSTSLSSSSYTYVVDTYISSSLHLRGHLFRKTPQASWDCLGEPYDPTLCWDDCFVCLTCSLCPGWRCQTHMWQMCRGLQVKELCALAHHASRIWNALFICPHGNLIYPEGCAEATSFGELPSLCFCCTFMILSL